MQGAGGKEGFSARVAAAQDTCTFRKEWGMWLTTYRNSSAYDRSEDVSQGDAWPPNLNYRK
jgi:hypothetical protein